MSEAVITTQGLTKKFGDFVAVDGVSFSVGAGEVVGYLGPNGSGKTTTIRMLLGLLRPQRRARARCWASTSCAQSEQVRQRVGYMSQKFALYHELTVAENLAFYAGVYGIRDRRRLAEVLELVGLRSMARRAGQRPLHRLAAAPGAGHRHRPPAQAALPG